MKNTNKNSKRKTNKIIKRIHYHEDNNINGKGCKKKNPKYESHHKIFKTNKALPNLNFLQISNIIHSHHYPNLYNILNRDVKSCAHLKIYHTENPNHTNNSLHCHLSVIACLLNANFLHHPRSIIR